MLSLPSNADTRRFVNQSSTDVEALLGRDLLGPAMGREELPPGVRRLSATRYAALRDWERAP